MALRGFVALVIALAGGCNARTSLLPQGDGGGPEDEKPGGPISLFLPSDGTRLKARWLETPDGQRSFAGWYDSLLQIDCTIARLADGELRCMPRGLSDGSTVFADAACLRRAVISPRGSCETERYAHDSDSSDPCQPHFKVYVLGERETAREFFLKRETTCSAAFRVSTGLAFQELGAELPPATFVRMQPRSEVPVTADDPLQLVVLEGEDGARDDGGWQLVRSSATCGQTMLDDGRWHCVPSGATADGDFADASCAQALVRFFAACAPPAVARLPSPDRCQPRRQLYEVGPRIESPFRIQFGGRCLAGKPHPGLEYRSVGAPLPDHTFPVLETRLSSSPGRLRRRHFVAPGGRARHDDWFDSVRNEPCAPELLEGQYRCAPASQSFQYLFSDERCTQPLHGPDSPACASPMPRYVTVTPEPGGCQPNRSLYAIGARHTGPVFKLVSESVGSYLCRRWRSADTLPLFRLERVPSSELVTMKLIAP